MRSGKKSNSIWKQNEHTTTQNSGDTVKAVLRGKFIAIQADLKKTEKSQIKNLTLHLKELQEQQQIPEQVEERK